MLMGGSSLEREVSLLCGQRVFEALAARGYKALALDVTPDLVETLRSEQPDAVYIALHGKYGEDGTIQEVLEFLDIPYTGPGVVASTLAWDKAVSKRLFREAGIPTPAWVTLHVRRVQGDGRGHRARPACRSWSAASRSSSSRPSRAPRSASPRSRRPTQLPEALLGALGYGDKAIVEKWIDGCELAVSVLDGAEDPRCCRPVEMVAKSGLFDFDGDVHARRDRLLRAGPAGRRGRLRACRELAGAGPRICSAAVTVSRVDMVVDDDGTP